MGQGGREEMEGGIVGDERIGRAGMIVLIARDEETV